MMLSGKGSANLGAAPFDSTAFRAAWRFRGLFTAIAGRENPLVPRKTMNSLALVWTELGRTKHPAVMNQLNLPSLAAFVEVACSMRGDRPVFREHRGQPLASAALMSAMTRGFVAAREDLWPGMRSRLCSLRIRYGLAATSTGKR